MNDVYEAWKKARAKAFVPEGFTDRVVAAAVRVPVSRIPVAIAVATGMLFALRAASSFVVFLVF